MEQCGTAVGLSPIPSVALLGPGPAFILFENGADIYNKLTEEEELPISGLCQELESG